MFFLLIISKDICELQQGALATQLLIVRKYAFKKMKGKARQMILHHILRNINESGCFKILSYSYIR